MIKVKKGVSGQLNSGKRKSNAGFKCQRETMEGIRNEGKVHKD